MLLSFSCVQSWAYYVCVILPKKAKSVVVFGICLLLIFCFLYFSLWKHGFLFVVLLNLNSSVKHSLFSHLSALGSICYLSSTIAQWFSRLEDPSSIPASDTHHNPAVFMQDNAPVTPQKFLEAVINEMTSPESWSNPDWKSLVTKLWLRNPVTELWKRLEKSGPRSHQSSVRD